MSVSPALVSFSTFLWSVAKDTTYEKNERIEFQISGGVAQE